MKPSSPPVETPRATEKAVDQKPSDTAPPLPAAPETKAAFTLPPGYDEAEAGLQQNDKDLMAQAMAVLPNTSPDPQAIRLIVASALGDSAAIAKETAQLDAAGTPSGAYSTALNEIARQVSGAKPDWKHLDEVADALNANKGCVLAYDALALFASKAGDKDRAAKYKKMAAAHAGEDG